MIENLSIGNSSNKINKKLKIEMQIEDHVNLLKSIFKIKSLIMFNTDEVKNLKTTNVVTMRFFNVEKEATN